MAPRNRCGYVVGDNASNLTSARYRVKSPVIDWVNVFATHRVWVSPREEIVQGVLLPELDADAPPVRTLLDRWDGAHFVRPTAVGTELTLVRRTIPPVRERWWLHLLLLAATLLSTTLSGAVFAGREPLGFAPFRLGTWEVFLPVRISPAQLVPGLSFSLPLLLILLAHEMGHYLTGRRRGMDVSPPYFIPAPFINLIGTFGAFIRLRSPMINRAMLLDVGAAGPLASFVLSLPLAAYGLWLSPVLHPPVYPPAPFVIPVQGEPFWIGGSAVLLLLARAFAHGSGVVVLHPFAIAAWFGFFVTLLNLFPLSQLDGGHVVYALLGRRQRYVAMAFLAALLVLGRVWTGWWIWAGLILALGRGSVAHPPVFDPEFPLSRGQRAVGWACVAILLLTFAPVPFPL